MTAIACPTDEPRTLDGVRDLQQLGARPDNGPRLNVLLLCDDRYPAGTTRQHIRALERHSRHRVYRFNPMVDDIRLLGGLGAFDVAVVHYSIFVLGDAHLPPIARDALRRFGGLKVQFIQDEYRRIDEITAAIRDLGVDVLLSSLRPHNAERVYGTRLPATRVVSNMPGYVSQSLTRRKVPPLASRPLHATYRSREVPFWLGRFARLKHDLALNFSRYAERSNLRVDISASEVDRRYGEDWLGLITSGKAVLGTEGGASIFDFSGDIERAARAYIERNPGAGFEEVHAAVLAPHEGNIVHRVLTPRLFEAITLRTALVLYPGEYNDLLKPWDHYIPLREDFANWNDVRAALLDDEFLCGLVARAYNDVLAPGHYSEERFVASFDRLLQLARAGRSTARARALRFIAISSSATARIATARLGKSAYQRYTGFRLALKLRARLRAIWTGGRSRTS